MKKITHTIKILIILTVLLFTNCSENHKEIEPTQIFEDSISLRGDKMNLNIDTLARPIHSILIDSFLIIMDKKLSNYNFHIINIKQKKYISSSCKKGKGPKEIAIPLGLYINPNFPRSFSTYARSKNKYFTFNIDSILNKKEEYYPRIVKTFSKSYLTPVQLQNKHFISTGPFKKGRYRISDSSLTNHVYKYSYPYDPNKKNISGTTKNMAYQGKFQLQPNGSHFAFATAYCGVIEFFKLDNNTVKKTEEHHFYNPDYLANETSAPLTRKNKMGFIDYSATNDFFYVLYSGRTLLEHKNKAFYGKDVLVFNWKGKSIRHYKLDKAVSFINVSDNNKTLYAYAALPKPAIFKYKLNYSQNR